jgi:hypothetical protein
VKRLHFVWEFIEDKCKEENRSINEIQAFLNIYPKCYKLDKFLTKISQKRNENENYNSIYWREMVMLKILVD